MYTQICQKSWRLGCRGSRDARSRSLAILFFDMSLYHIRKVIKIWLSVRLHDAVRPSDCCAVPFCKAGARVMMAAVQKSTARNYESTFWKPKPKLLAIWLRKGERRSFTLLARRWSWCRLWYFGSSDSLRLGSGPPVRFLREPKVLSSEVAGIPLLASSRSVTQPLRQKMHFKA